MTEEKAELQRRTLEDVRKVMAEEAMLAERRKKMLESYDLLMSKKEYTNMVDCYQDAPRSELDFVKLEYSRIQIGPGHFRISDCDLRHAAVCGRNGEFIREQIVDKLCSIVDRYNHPFVSMSLNVPRPPSPQVSETYLIQSFREICQTKYGTPFHEEIERENVSRRFNVQELTSEGWEIKKGELGLNPGRSTLEAKDMGAVE